MRLICTNFFVKCSLAFFPKSLLVYYASVILINALNTSGKVKALVHFGNPYAIKPINHITRVILGYTAPESQNYAIEVLSGKIEAKGKLPFDIKLN